MKEQYYAFRNGLEAFPSSTKTLVLYWVYVDYPMVLYRPDVLKW